MCQLNPLKICIPSVVNLFAAITRYLLIYFISAWYRICVYLKPTQGFVRHSTEYHPRHNAAHIPGVISLFLGFNGIPQSYEMDCSVLEPVWLYLK